MGTQRYSVLRDPVHGDIYLTQEEMRLLDTTGMQRLRGVRQLGTAYLVFPGAQHTRFEHSLGTLALTARLIDAVNLNRSLEPGVLTAIAEDEARILRAAALVHDITHMPFGHNIEDQSGILERHDSPQRFARVLGEDRPVGAALAAMGIRAEVLAILAPAAGSPASIPPYWQQIVSDTICADILDYLKRDAYFTGLNLLYDERVINYFKVDRQSGLLFVDVAKRGLVREDILSELVRVLDARYFFSERVYYHHAKVAAGAMIARAVEDGLREGAFAPEQLYEQTDDSLLALLARSSPDLMSRLRSRLLLKRACVYPLYANRSQQDQLIQRFFSPGQAGERRALEEAIVAHCAASGTVVPFVLLYCPARRMQLKEAATHVRFPGEATVRPLSAFRDLVPRLTDLERSYRDLWKLYLLAPSDDPRVLAAVAAAAAHHLPEACNVYQPRGAVSR